VAVGISKIGEGSTYNRKMKSIVIRVRMEQVLRATEPALHGSRASNS
jgi:hypothetical protein